MVNKLTMSLVLVSGLGLAACTNPYDPGQRAVGGGVLGAGTGAAVGAIAGGGRGAAVGALVGGGVGALGGAATTPNQQVYEQPGYYEPQPQVYQPQQRYYQPRPYGY